MQDTHSTTLSPITWPDDFNEALIWRETVHKPTEEKGPRAPQGSWSTPKHTRKQVEAKLKKYPQCNLGVFIPNGRMFCVDFDFAKDESELSYKHAALTQRAKEVLIQLDSCLYHSASGKGLHLWVTFDGSDEDWALLTGSGKDLRHPTKTTNHPATGDLLLPGCYCVETFTPPSDTELSHLATRPVRGITLEQLTYLNPEWVETMTKAKTASVHILHNLSSKSTRVREDAVLPEELQYILSQIPAKTSSIHHQAYKRLRFSSDASIYGHFINVTMVVQELITRDNADCEGLFKVYTTWAREDPAYADLSDDYYVEKLASFKKTGEDGMLLATLVSLAELMQPDWSKRLRLTKGTGRNTVIIYPPDILCTSSALQLLDHYKVRPAVHAYDPEYVMARCPSELLHVVFPNTVKDKDTIIKPLQATEDVFVPGVLDTTLMPQIAEQMTSSTRDRAQLNTLLCNQMAGKLAVNPHKYTYDPIAEIINSTKWDGVSRLQNYYDTISYPYDQETIDHINTGRLAQLSHFVGIRQSTVDTIHIEMPLIFVMCGGQGATKSSLMSDYLMHSDITDLWGAYPAGEIWPKQTKNSDQAVAALKLAKKPIVLLNEFENVLDYLSESYLKEQLSITERSVRLAYGKYMMNLPARNMFIGSSNKKQFMLDHSGHRRLLMAAITSINQRAAQELDFIQLMAEVAHRNVEEIAKLKAQGSITDTTWRLSNEWIMYNDKHMNSFKGDTATDEAIIEHMTGLHSDEPFNGLIFRQLSQSERAAQDRVFTIPTLQKIIYPMGNVPRNFKHAVQRFSQEYTSTEAYQTRIAVGTIGFSNGRETNVLSNGSYHYGRQEFFVFPPKKGVK